MPTDLSCQRCGGPLPGAAARGAVTCPFCGAASVPPPEVIERVVERIVVERASDGDAGAKLHCPRCAEPLHEGTARQTIFFGCRRCAGLWIDKATLDRLSRTTDDELQRLLRAVSHKEPKD